MRQQFPKPNGTKDPYVKTFGKVLTPLKVHTARMALAFGLFYAKIGKLDKELTLPPESVLLIREQARFQDTDTKQSCLSAL